MTRDEILNLARCDECPLSGRHEPVLGCGSNEAALVLIGEAPGANEIADGRPFSGRSGQLLDLTLKEVGTSRDAVYTTNAVLCRPPTDGSGKDTPPPATAIAACRDRLTAEVTARRPS